MNPQRLITAGAIAVGALAWWTHAAWAAPADRVPTPKAKACVPFEPDVAEGEMATPKGLGITAVRTSLGAVIQHALHCSQPEGFHEVHLTFDILVGCNGLVSKLEVVDDGGAPEDYVSCVSAVIAKADFPAHDMADGMTITYPVNAAW